jgi:hypothetical protein
MRETLRKDGTPVMKAVLRRRLYLTQVRTTSSVVQARSCRYWLLRNAADATCGLMKDSGVFHRIWHEETVARVAWREPFCVTEDCSRGGGEPWKISCTTTGTMCRSASFSSAHPGKRRETRRIVHSPSCVINKGAICRPSLPSQLLPERLRRPFQVSVSKQHV